MNPKNTFFYTKKTLNCKGKILDLSTPKIMGIVNITPDSFFDGGKIKNDKDFLIKIEQQIMDGADIIDIGGQSTKPGSKLISEKIELTRTLNKIKLIQKKFPDVIVSIDTFYSQVAQKAIENGASIINDISGGALDPKMFETVARLKVPYILTHMQGTPKTMQTNPRYENVIEDIFQFFITRIHLLNQLKINDIIIDLGFGFGKNLQHNYLLLKKLPLFKILNLPILVGVSRKSMIGKLLKISPPNSLNGTTAVHTICLLNGANILRVHDVKEAKETITINQYYNNVTI